MGSLTAKFDVAEFVSRRVTLLRAGGWSVGSFAGQQVIRLGTNIVLAWLLAPALLGTMLLINTLRTGGELLTDVGIGQSVVNHERGEEPDFFNTAWTVQIVRGMILFAIALLVTLPLADLYDDERLKVLLPAAAFIFVLNGFISPARFLLQRRLKTKALAIYRLAAVTLGSAFLIALAYVMPTIWALVIGLLVQGVIGAVLSFFLLDWRQLRLRWDKSAVKAIIRYGKWVFLSSLVYFAATNFDRLYLAEAIPFAVLGVYGIARTLSDSVLQLFQHVSSQIVFPKVSTSKLRGPELAQKMAGLRRGVVWIIALALAAGLAVGDWFISFAYDERYQAAAIYFPILLAGSWFGTLAAISESVLMGIGKPSNVAVGNATKLGAIVVLVPFALTTYGMVAAVIVFAAVETVRWLVLTWRQKVHGIGFFGQDIAATLGFVLAALMLRELTGMIGLTSGIAGWVEMMRGALG